MTVTVITNAEHDGVKGCEVAIEHGQVVDISRTITPGPRGSKIEAGGGAILPGLWDHHTHLLATAALGWSVNVAGVKDINNLVSILLQEIRHASSDGLRVVGYDDDALGYLDGPRLDRLIETTVPIRVQHRSGHQWVFNEAARQTSETSAGLDDAGVVWDERSTKQQASLPEHVREAISSLIYRMASNGCVGVTDMSAAATAADIRALRALVEPTLCMAAYGMPDAGNGAVKRIAADHEYPDPDEVVSWMATNGGRVAIHTVTAETLAVITTAREKLGPHVRLEHVFLANDELLAELSYTGVEVGVQPGFIWTHGERVLRNYSAQDAEQYQALGSMLRAGFRMFGGTDQPYAPGDLWLNMQTAVARKTQGGQLFSADQSLTPEQAFALFTREGLQHDAQAPRLVAGQSAELCVIDRSWRAAREDLSQVSVGVSMTGGKVTWLRN